MKNHHKKRNSIHAGSQWWVIWVFLFAAGLVSCTTRIDEKTPAPTYSTPIVSATTPTRIFPTEIIGTPTHYPRVPYQEADNIIVELMNDNGDCQSPCFWGFPIYTTNIYDVENYLQSLNFSIFYPETAADELFNATRLFDNGDGFSFAFFENENHAFVNVEVTGVDLAGSDEEITTWEYYQLENVIAKYGTPDRIQFGFVYGAEGHYSYHIDLQYIDEEFLISYQSDVKYEYSPTICPFMDHEMNWFRAEIGNHYSDLDQRSMTIDQVSSINLEDFAALSTQNKEDACFTVNPGVFGP